LENAPAAFFLWQRIMEISVQRDSQNHGCRIEVAAYEEGALMVFGRDESSDYGNIGTAVTFLLIGMGVGALAALLFAPKTGKQLRQDIRRSYEDAKDAVEDFAEDAKDRVEGAIERGADWVDEVGASARKKVGPIARAARRG
jgi:gas vesicle protein